MEGANVMRRAKSHSDPQVLKEFLENHTVPVLKKLAGLLERGLPSRKAEIMAVIRKHMENPDRLRELWGYLDPLQQAAVTEVVHASSCRFDTLAFRAKYGDVPDWGTKSRWSEMEEPSLLCLFIYKNLMPCDLKKQLQEFVPPPRAANVRPVDEPPETVSQWGYDHIAHRRQSYEIPIFRCETERAAQHDLRAVLRLIDNGKVRASEKTKRVSAAGARAVTGVLQGGDFYPSEPDKERDPWQTAPGHIKAFAWPLILQSAGLANLSGTRLQLTPAGKKALTSPPPKTIRRTWNRWLKTTLLDEFNRVDTIKGQTGKGKRKMTATSGRRAAIVKALKTCPPHEWIAFDEFSRFMRASGYTFQVSRDLWSLYILDPQYGSLGYSGVAAWDILQERYMLVFLFEYAATMGLIDIAYIHPSDARPIGGDLWGTDDMDCLSRYDGLLYIRINGLGDWCLGQTEAYTPSPLEIRQVLQVLPNREVVAVGPLSPGDELFLETFASKASDVVWKIEPLKLLEALERGEPASDIEAFLKARSGDDLPDNVAIFFKEVAERASRLVDRGTARLIEVQDAALAQLIANDRRLRSLCMLAGERHIVVPAEAEKAFRRGLRELGYGLLPSGS